MSVVLSLLLALAILGGGGSFVRHVARNVTPQSVRARAAARVRRPVVHARGKLPAKVQDQIDKAVKARVAANVKQHLAGTIPVIRKAAAQARAKQATAAKPAAKPAPPARPADAKPRPLKVVPPLPAIPAGAPVPVMRPDHPAPVPPPRKDQPVTTSQVPVTAPGSAGADLFAAMRMMITHAENGGLQAKQRGLATLAEVLDYQAQVLDELARRLAEPDQGYPASVWEPVTTSAAHVRAAQTKLGDASSGLAHLVSLSLGEASASGQKIPHHDQVNSGT